MASYELGSWPTPSRPPCCEAVPLTSLCYSPQTQAPRTGLARPNAGRGGGRAGSSGFLPPFVNKAIDAQNGNGQAPPGGGGSGGGCGDAATEGPLSARTLEMLGGAHLHVFMLHALRGAGCCFAALLCSPAACASSFQGTGGNLGGCCC